MDDNRTKQNPAGGPGFGKSQTNGRGLQWDSSMTNRLRALYQGDPRTEFLSVIREALGNVNDPDRIVLDNRICRFGVDGDKRGTLNGWAVGFTDAHGSGGAYGHWRTGISGTWHQGRSNATPEERRRLAAAIAEATAQRNAERLERTQEAAQRAVELWQQAATPHPRHPYLVNKHIQPHGIRQLNKLLTVPLRDADGKLWSLQFIAPDGTKRFLSGGRKRGCYFSIGKVDGELLIAEGFATAASLHEATSKAVAVAFDCGNMEPVARVLRAKFLTTTITICADNDTGTDGNPGLTKATAAARAIGGKVAIPPPPFCDFNDAAIAEVMH